MQLSLQNLTVNLLNKVMAGMVMCFTLGAAHLP